MSNFKIGDRVKVISESCKTYGQTGIVIDNCYCDVIFIKLDHNGTKNYY